MPEIPITSLPPRLQRQAELARTAIDRGNAEYAVNICREVLQREPGCLAVRRLLRAAQLKTFRERNRFVAKTIGGINAMPALVSAQSLVKKDPARALIAAEKALSADPTNIGALRIEARAATALGFFETAVFALEAACEHSGNNVGLLIELTDAFIAAGRSIEALRVAERLLAQHPNHAGVQELVKRASVAKSITAGRWDSGSGTYRDKLRDEQQAVSLEQGNKAVASDEMTLRLIHESIARAQAEPFNLNHHRAVVSGYRSLGRLDDALEWVGKARAVPGGAADPALAKLESDLRIERVEARIKERSVTVTALGGDLATDQELKQLNAELAQVRIADLRELAEKYPNDHTYKFELGRLLQANGQLDGAIQQFQLAQRNPKLRLAALRHLGDCFRAKGLHDLAVQQYETAKAELIIFDDEKKEIVYQLAACYEAMGRPDKALEEYKLIYSTDIGFRDVATKIDSFYSRP